MNNTKLQKEIEVLTKKHQKIGCLLRNKEDEFTRLVSLPNLKKSVGKCFKYRNSYGGDSKKWYLYTKIVSIDEKTMTFTCVEFQRTSMDMVEIKYAYKYNWGGENAFKKYGNYIPIPDSEYNRAKKTLLKFVQDKLSQ